MRYVSSVTSHARCDQLNATTLFMKLLATKYALANFMVYLLGNRHLSDHASLRAAVNSPHLSQRMARRFSFFACITSSSSISQDDLTSSLTHSLAGCSTRHWSDHCRGTDFECPLVNGYRKTYERRMIREWCEGCIISRNHPGRASNSISILY